MIKILSRHELHDWVQWLHSRGVSPDAGIILLVGDRLTCCDEAVGVVVKNQVVAVATISPQCEEHSGEPTIIALYTLPALRRQGYGQEAFVAALARCRERGFKRVRVDVLSNHVMRIIASLPKGDQEYLDVHDLGSPMDLLG